jgi:hypothetical protein
MPCRHDRHDLPPGTRKVLVALNLAVLALKLAELAVVVHARRQKKADAELLAELTNRVLSSKINKKEATHGRL